MGKILFPRSLESFLLRPGIRVFAAIATFSIGYALLNYKLLVARILYRWAANDISGAISNALAFALQAGLLVMLLIILRGPARIVLIALVAVSGLVNVTHAQILEANIDLASMTWMLAETNQLIPALIEFWPGFLKAAVKVGLAVVLIYFGGKLLAERLTWLTVNRSRYLLLGWILVLPAFLFSDLALSMVSGARGAEINAYGLAIRAYLQSHPARQVLSVTPDREPLVRNIVWLVDESVSAAHFQAAMQPQLTQNLAPIDFREATSFANCSSPSNAALRWGVNVDAISLKTDLRTTPTIWAYAHAAGYRTFMIDGQVSGAPQNYVWAPERQLIDQLTPAKAGIETDKQIANQVNSILKTEGRHFVYVVFRGAHYQYHSNYPAGELSSDSSLVEKYRKAIEYSKRGVFQSVLDGVEEDVAVFYTSDHGQVLRDGMVPHCNTIPYADEYSVPLVLFLPKRIATDFQPPSAVTRRWSHSQIFPTSLVLMGYPVMHAQDGYDNPLPNSSKKIVTFGKTLFPQSEGESIDVRVERKYQ